MNDSHKRVRLLSDPDDDVLELMRSVERVQLRLDPHQGENPREHLRLDVTKLAYDQGGGAGSAFCDPLVLQ